MKRARIIRITPNQAHELVTPSYKHRISGRSTYGAPGLYYTKENGMYVGIDNSTGHAWVEEFKSRRQCLKWLRGTEPS